MTDTGQAPMPDDVTQPFERALWRANQLIALGADEGEPEETQLSDVLADLMHWANHTHVDFDAAVASAEHAREQELAEWDVVKVDITNTYADGHESSYEVWLPIWEGDAPDDDWWQDVVFPHTGDGHDADGGEGSHYEAIIIELSGANASDTTLCGVTYEWMD